LPVTPLCYENKEGTLKSTFNENKEGILKSFCSENKEIRKEFLKQHVIKIRKENKESL